MNAVAPRTRWALPRAGRNLAGGLAVLAAPVLCPAQTEAPGQDVVAALAERLDQAFGRRDPEAFLAAFVPLHPGLHAKFAERVRRILRADVRLERKSEVARYWRLGEHAVVAVTSEICNPERPALGKVRENALWAVRGPTDAPRIVLAVDVDADMLDMLPESGDPLQPKNRIRCRACNYSIRANDDWLMVPNCTARTGCLESFSFYSLRHSLSADLSVHLAREVPVPSPARMLRQLVERAVGTAPDTVTIEPWLPPMYAAANRPTYLDGARCVVAPAGRDDPRAEVHLATYGRLGYLMVVRGQPEVLDANRESVQDLMKTFALDDPQLEPEQVIARITQERQGGLLDGTVYTNRRYQVRFAGPAGWTACMEASHYAFDVSWRHPDGSASLRLKALVPPGGVERWTPQAAERTLRNACVRGAMTVERDTGWEDCAQGFAHDRWVESAASGSGSERHTLLRMALDDDLFVVAELRTDGPASEELRRVVDGLARTR